jgi:DNA invertase Pin-like site-specific DNA recombinase
MFRDAVIAILATIAKQEHARLSERVIAGLRRAKREGKTLGRKRMTKREEWQFYVSRCARYVNHPKYALKFHVRSRPL